MKILITGSEGFIGSHVCDLLEEKGYKDLVKVDAWEPRVHADSVPPEDVHTTPVARLSADLLEGVECVIHLAAQVGVADSMEDPSRYIMQNTWQTARLMQLLPPSVGRVVVASSMSVYGPGGPLITEADPVQPASIYGLTKYDQERLVLMWGHEAESDAIALRFFNVYGPRQALDNPYTGVLANFSKRLLSGLPPIVYEDGQQTRDFVYIRDVAEAVVLSALSPLAAGRNVWNVATGEATTIEETALALAEALKVDLEPEITGERRAGDIRHCTGDPTKIKRELGWRPKTSFSEGIAEYGDWLLERYAVAS